MAIVYLHKRNDTNQVFYVGIGLGEIRAYKKNGRSRHWYNIVNKHGYTVEIIHKDIEREEACLIEKDLIAYYGRLDLKTGLLINLTDGGDGMSNVTESVRIINLERIKAIWRNPEKRKKLTDKATEQMKNPEFKKKFTEGTRNKWKEPEYRLKKSFESKKQWENVAFRAKMKEVHLAKWQEPEFIEMQRAKMLRVTKDPAFIEKRRIGLKKKWQETGFRESQRLLGLSKTSNPEHRRKLTEGIKLKWDNPDFRKKMTELARAAMIKNNPNSSKIIDMQSKIIFKTMIEAAVFYERSPSTIRTWAKNKTKIMYYSDYVKL